MNKYVQGVKSICQLFYKVRGYNIGLSPMRIWYNLIYVYKHGYVLKFFRILYKLTKYFKTLNQFFEKYQNTFRLLEQILYFYDRLNYIMYILKFPLNWFVKSIKGKMVPKNQLIHIFLHILIRYYFLINAVKPFYKKIYNFFKRLIRLNLIR